MSFINPSHTRHQFSHAMSAMYGREVPAYTTLINLVNEINQTTLATNPELKKQLTESDNLSRITDERHGAIRLGKVSELHMMRRLFAVMGMYPVGYYDLSVAGLPVHSTAFRPIERKHLAENPFRVFTSLLRLDLIEDRQLATAAEDILEKRDIFTIGVKELIDIFETQGGLTPEQSEHFVDEALETFRWHSEATVSFEMYQQLHNTHRLVADVVSFKGPHINHLTPRTLDIDYVQQAMPQKGITPKTIIEGPPPRHCPILLRQTSFKALEESVKFLNAKGHWIEGSHTARFGEIEQRGVALTQKGRALYDRLLNQAREHANQNKAISYEQALAEAFDVFPDNWEDLRQQKLAFFEYHADTEIDINVDLEDLIASGKISVTPITYEDFLPVSAAGIFQSNLGADDGQNFTASANQLAFEQALGTEVIDEFKYYENIQQQSIDSLK